MGIFDARLEDKMKSSETVPLTLWSRYSTRSDRSTYYSSARRRASSFKAVLT